jgi:hypothetical protein
MNKTTDNKIMHRPMLTPEELARLGGGVLAYVREIGSSEALKLLGEKVILPRGQKLFCLCNADGTPISISDSREAAIGQALENELVPASLH